MGITGTRTLLYKNLVIVADLCHQKRIKVQSKGLVTQCQFTYRTINLSTRQYGSNSENCRNTNIDRNYGRKLFCPKITVSSAPMILITNSGLCSAFNNDKRKSLSRFLTWSGGNYLSKGIQKLMVVFSASCDGKLGYRIIVDVMWSLADCPLQKRTSDTQVLSFGKLGTVW